MKMIGLKSNLLRSALALFAIALIGVCQANPANAAFKLRLTHVESATTVIIEDQVGGPFGDLDLVNPGRLIFSGAVGIFTVNLDSGLSKPLIGSPPNFAQMDLLSQNTSTGAGTLKIEMTDTSFAAFPGNNGVFYAAAGGTNSAGTSTFDGYKDYSNPPEEFGIDDLSISLGTLGPGAFSNSSFIFHGPIPTYTMTMVAVIRHNGAGTSSFDFELINATPDRIPGIPEPTTMAIWGLGALGFAALRLRRQKLAA
jgi:PEP-CTERM motif